MFVGLKLVCRLEIDISGRQIVLRLVLSLMIPLYNSGSQGWLGARDLCEQWGGKMNFLNPFLSSCFENLVGYHRRHGYVTRFVFHCNLEQELENACRGLLPLI